MRRPQPRRVNAAGIWRGIVVKVTAAGHVHVTVPRLGRHVFGPGEAAAGVAALGGETGSADAHAHSTSGPLVPGDRVIVAFLEHGDGEFVVIGRLT